MDNESRYWKDKWSEAQKEREELRKIVHELTLKLEETLQKQSLSS